MKQQGMTLLELTVVLLILLALAGLAIPYVGGTSNETMCKTNDVSMVNIKKAIMEGYYLDTLGKFPQDLDGLTPNSTFTSRDYNLHYLFSDTNPLDTSRTHKAYNPSNNTGWRTGGYLQNGMQIDVSSEMSLSLKNDLKTVLQQPTILDTDLSKYIFTMDGWGRPFVLQAMEAKNSSCPEPIKSASINNKCCWDVLTTEAVCARILSAGKENGVGLLATLEDSQWFETSLTESRDGDDRVLYLNIPTPPGDVNEDCSRY